MYVYKGISSSASRGQPFLLHIGFILQAIFDARNLYTHSNIDLKLELSSFVITWRITQSFGQLRRLCHGGKRVTQLFEGQRCGQLCGRCGRWWQWWWCGWVITERVRAQMCWKIVIHTCIARRCGGDQSDSICWPGTRSSCARVLQYVCVCVWCAVCVSAHIYQTKPNQNQTQP